MNWNAVLHITKFDPGLGTLTGIRVSLDGQVRGDIRYENTGPGPQSVYAYLQAQITLSRPDLSTIAVTAPVVSKSDALPGYDGVLDYGGLSGRTYLKLAALDSSSANSEPPSSDLALFTGLGTIALPIAAVATSYASPSGNVSSLFTTSAGATVTVTYLYNPPTTGSLMMRIHHGATAQERAVAGIDSLTFHDDGMVWIPAGTFTMGSPTDEPGRVAWEIQHEVTLTHAIYVSAYEVTQSEWLAAMGWNSSHLQGANLPVETLT